MTDRNDPNIDSPNPAADPEHTANVRGASRWSPVWIVPIAAIVIGLWTLVQHYLSQGPEIRVTFATAEGLVAGETKVKTLDVDIGVVEAVQLADDFESVRVRIKLEPQTAPLLTENAQFWVVRPHIGTQGISGLSTILSGAYIQLSPGDGAPGRRDFRGLDEMPLTPPSTPGLQLQLLADNASSINVGSPLLYNGYQVGRIEDVSLDSDNGQTHYTAFIESPYDSLVRSTTRFWNASGVAVSVDVGGFNVRTESLEALLTGGVTFGIPEGLSRGLPVNDGQTFYLYDDIGDLTENPHVNAAEYTLLFDSSIRGLEVGAPVDFRGMRVGTVLSVGLQEWDALWDEDRGTAMPVIVHIEPGWLGEDTAAAADAFAQSLNAAVQSGLRASLAIGNLLTGQLYVSLDFHEDVTADEVRNIEGALHLPTVASGLDQIEASVANFLSKLQQLPLEETLDNASTAMSQASQTMTTSRKTLNALTDLLQSDDINQLPASVTAALTDAQSVLRSFGPDAALQAELLESLQQLKTVLNDADAVIQTYERQPNAFVFPSKQPVDPQPQRGTP